MGLLSTMTFSLLFWWRANKHISLDVTELRKRRRLVVGGIGMHYSLHWASNVIFGVNLCFVSLIFALVKY